MTQYDPRKKSPFEIAEHRVRSICVELEWRKDIKTADLYKLYLGSLSLQSKPISYQQCLKIYNKLKASYKTHTNIINASDFKQSR